MYFLWGKKLFLHLQSENLKKMFRLLSIIPSPADSARDVQFIPSGASEITQEIAREDDVLMTVYFCALLVALAVCALMHYVYRKRIREYGNIINLNNLEIAKQKLKADSYGVILNSVLFPCCLVSEKGIVGWCNDAFIDFYGKDLKTFDFLSGLADNEDVNKIRDAKYAVHYFVKKKNVAGKTIGFKRTLVPLSPEADGTKNYAIVENINS